VRHRPRKHGQSKYGVMRMLKGFLDLLTVRFLTRFSQRPLHVLGGIGVAMLTVGGLVLIYLAVSWLDPANRPIGERPLLFYAGVLVSMGTQLLSLGILAEHVTAYNIRPEDTYSVVERIPTRDEPAPAAAVPEDRSIEDHSCTTKAS
jgi:hypothetical protein